MKSPRRLILRIALSVFALMFAAGVALAQDAVKVDPKHFKVAFENDRVRVLEFHGKAGDKIPTHSHPAGFTYNFTAGKTKFTIAGKTVERESKAGQVTWSDGETHSSEMMGPGESHALIVELKGGGAMKAAEAKAPEKKAPAKKQ